MNSADVFSLEFDMLTRTSSLAKILERFRSAPVGAATHRQLLLELNHRPDWVKIPVAGITRLLEPETTEPEA